MLNLKKTITLAAIALFSFNSYALDKESTISESAMKIISSIEKEFKLSGISSETKKQLDNQISFALQDDWYSWWIGNEDLTSSKFKKSKVRIYDLIVSTLN